MIGVVGNMNQQQQPMDRFNKPFTIFNQSDTCGVKSESCLTSQHLSSRQTSGKRRLSNRTIDDQYGGSKQRQKLGNAVTYNLEFEKNFNFSEMVFDAPYLSRLNSENGTKELDRNYAINRMIDPVKATMSWTAYQSGNTRWNHVSANNFHSTLSLAEDVITPEQRSIVTADSSSAEKRDLDICNRLALGVENMDIQSDLGNHFSPHVTSSIADLTSFEMNASFPDYINIAETAPVSKRESLQPDFRTPTTSQPCLSLTSVCVGNWQHEEQTENRGWATTNARGGRIVRRLRKSTGKSSRVKPPQGGLSSSNGALLPSCRPDCGSDLEAIFSEMGVDHDPSSASVGGPYPASDQLRVTTSLNVVETISSIGTPLGSHSCGSTGSHKMDDSFLQCLDIEDPPIAFMSARERNARIIKWLYSIRRPAVVNEDGTIGDN